MIFSPISNLKGVSRCVYHGNFVVDVFMPFILVGVLDKYTQFQAVLSFKIKNIELFKTWKIAENRVKKMTFQILEHTKWYG